MMLCRRCHDILGCGGAHPPVGTASTECGICAAGEIAVDCHCPAAREIDSFNRSVRTFAVTMRRKFIENMAKGKGGWEAIDYGFAFRRLLHEAGELGAACMAFVKGPAAHEAIVDESADVANFALFLAHRAWTDASVDMNVARVGHDAWVKMRKDRGECYNTCGPCEASGLPAESHCDVCKARLAKKQTERREVRS